MKRHISLFTILMLLLASCSNLGYNQNSGDISISGKQILARAVTENESDVLSLKVTMTDTASKEKLDYTEKTGTQAELSASTVTFKDIEIGKTIKIDCEISLGEKLLWTGESTPVTIVAGSTPITITMKKVESKDAKYTIEYYYEKLDYEGDEIEYEINADETVEEIGIIGETTAVTSKDVEGFTSQDIEQSTITADGSTVIKIYYNRKTITILIDIDAETLGADDDSLKAPIPLKGKYGAETKLLDFWEKNIGGIASFELIGWQDENGELVDFPETFTKDATYKAQWEEIPMENAEPEQPEEKYAEYTIEHYYETPYFGEDGKRKYKLKTDETRREDGIIGNKTDATINITKGFVAQEFEQLEIKADGSTVVKIYYNRKPIVVTVNLNGGKYYGWKEGTLSLNCRYGMVAVAAAEVSKDGYTFVGWKDENGERWQNEGDFWTDENGEFLKADPNDLLVTFTEDKTFTAVWEEDQIDSPPADSSNDRPERLFTQAEFRRLVPNYDKDIDTTFMFEIPEGYTKIVSEENESVFAGWKNLNEDPYTDTVMITIPKSVTHIDAYAFYGCNNFYFNFQDRVGWMYFKSDGSGSEYLTREKLHYASLENMKNGTGYMKKVSVIDVEFPGDNESYYTISPSEYEYDMATGESKIKKHEKGSKIEFSVLIMPNHHDEVGGDNMPQSQLVDDTAHTIVWFVDGVLQSGETRATFTWNTESAFIGRHEILCVIDGKYSVVSNPIVIEGTTN